MNVEKAFEIVGTCGKYQLFLVFLMFLSNFLISIQMVITVIVGATPNISISAEQGLSTIVTSFDLYDKQWVVELTQSLFMAGYMLGCVSFGQVSDMYGRKFVIIPTMTLTGICAVCSGLTYSWKTFAVSRFFVGVFTGGLVSTYTLMMELIGSSAWKWAGILYQSFFSLGMMFLSLLAFLVLDWRIVCYISGGSFLLLTAVCAVFLLESPRWLSSNGRLVEAERILRKLASENGLSREAIQEIVLEEVEEKQDRKITFLEVFKFCKLTTWLIANCIVWMCSAVIYYGLTMSASDLTSNLFLAVALSGVIEIPGSLFCIFLLGSRRFGRKGTLLLTFIICFISCVGISIKPDGDIVWRLGFGLPAKLSIAAAFNVLYIYTVEIFPTPLRTISIGFSSTIGRVGAIIAPFITLLKDSGHPNMPYFIFAGSALLSSLCILILPKTFGYKIPQTIEEALNRQNKSLSNRSYETVRLITDDEFSEEN